MPGKDIAFDCSSEEYEELLTVAALFEGPFSIDWIQGITRKKATRLLFAFERAVHEKLLKRDRIGYFIFTNGRKRRQWLGKLGEREKEDYYRMIADMLSRELPDSDQKAEILAPYLLNVDNDMAGCNWLMTAAGRYRAAFKEESALKCYSKVLDDLSGRFGQGADPLFCDAALQYSKLTTARHETPRVLSILEEAMVRAKNQGNHRYQSLLDMHFAKNKWLQSQYSSALKHFEQAWALAGDLQDDGLARSMAAFKTFFLFWQGRFQEAVDDYEKRVPEVEKFPHGRFPLLAAMTIGTCYGKVGQVTQGIGMIDAVRRHCLERGDTGLAAHSGICMGAIMLDSGHLEEALRHLIPSVEQAQTAHPDWTMIQGELVLAYAYYLKDKEELCLAHLTRYNRHARKVQVSVRTWSYLMELCWAVEAGRLPAVAGISLADEIGRMIKGQNLFLAGVAHRFKFLMQKKEGAPAAAQIKTLARSIELLEISGHAVELAKTRLALARCHLLKGDRALAVQTAEPAFKALSAFNENLIPDDLKPLIRRAAPAESLLKEIVRFSSDLAAGRRGRDMIQHIISVSNRIIGAERGAVFLWEGGLPAHGFQLRASKNLTRTQIEHPNFAASIKLMTEVATGKTGRLKGDAAPAVDDAGPQEEIRSCICVPIAGNQKISGVLYHDNRLLGSAFDASQLQILSFFAGQIALALENDRLYRENRRLDQRLREFTAIYEKHKMPGRKMARTAVIGRSAAMEKVLCQVGEVAPTTATVLILGETGVGKEVIARAIQANSDRKDRPFISLNCNALSETLIYSELFGHEKGAFTNADRRHIGRFEKADRGTLFLDEIGELPPDIQVRLLRVLETKTFERVGGTATIHSDFRLIAATNTDLMQAVKEKKFRKDLFYRLNVFSIHVPPLRERSEDIPLLIDHFLKVQAGKAGKTARPVTPEELQVLTRYNWPGNVRELKNIVERYAISGPSTRSGMVELLNTGNGGGASPRPAVTLKENERRHILWALGQTEGKIHGPGGAAELLDIHPNTLSFRMKKLEIKKERPPRHPVAGST